MRKFKLRRLHCGVVLHHWRLNQEPLPLRHKAKSKQQQPPGEWLFSHNGAKTCKQSPVWVLINQLLCRRRATGSTFRSPPPINSTHPQLSPSRPVRVASLPLSGCSIMQIHCLLFTASVTISWHESQQGPGGPCRVTGREAEEETLRRRRQESESPCAKIKARHREKGIFFFLSF